MKIAESHLLQAAMALYALRESGLWLIDPEFQETIGHGRPLWNDYVVWLSRYFDFKRTKLLDWVSALRIMAGGLDIPVQDIVEEGMDLEPVVVLKRHIDYHWKSGEVRGVREKKLLETLPPGPDLKSRIQTAVLEIASLPNVEERMRRVEQLIGQDDDIDSPREVLYFLKGPDHLGRWHMEWAWGGNHGIFGRDATPSYVIDDMRSKSIRFIIKE